MSQLFTCRCGHSWALSSPTSASLDCPACGADLRHAVANDGGAVLETATLAPPAPVDGEAITIAPVEQLPAAGASVAVPGYEVLAELGRGGMGVVYQARHLKLNRRVALKMILAGSHAGEADLARFQTEAEAIARLRHANIVQVYEVGEHEGKPFFSLEFCDGGSLEKKLNGTPLPAREAAALVETLARAMQAAHEQHVIHRDLKPANVLLSFSRDAESSERSALRVHKGALRSEDSASRLNEFTPKITDFGLAKKLDEAGQTQSGAIVGTPSYMAPEQAGYKPDAKTSGIGPACDVYALGAILYECLTGRPPFKAATALDTIMQVVSDEPVPPSQLQTKTPGDLETICLKCLQKEPSKRYPTARELADDFRRFLDGEPIRARPVGVVEKTVKWMKRRPVVAGLLASLVVMAAVSGVLISSSYREALSQAKIAKEERDAARLAEKSESEAKDREGQLKRKAEEDLELNERVLTRIRVDQANAALRDNKPVDGLSRLESCPPKTRSWEWYYTRRLCRGAPLTLHEDGGFWNVVFSPDGRWIAANSREGLKLFDALTGAEKMSIPGNYYYSIIAFSPDSSRVAAWVGGFNQVKKVWDVGLKVWEVHAGKEVLTIPGNIVGRGGRLVFSPDGKWLAGAGGDGNTIVWNAVTGKKNCDLAMKNGHRPVQMAWSPDSSWLAVHDNEEVRFLDPVTRKEKKPPIPAKGIEGGDYLSDFHPDGRRLALVAVKNETRVIRVLDLGTGTQLQEIPAERGSFLKYSPDCQRLALADNNLVRICDSANGKVLGMLPNDKRFNLSSMSFSPDGQRLAVGTRDNALEVWNVRDLTGGQTLRGHTNKVVNLAFRPDGRQLLTIANLSGVWESDNLGGGFGFGGGGFGFGGGGALGGIPAGGFVGGGFGALGGGLGGGQIALDPFGGIKSQRWGAPAWELKRWDVDGGFAVRTLLGHSASLTCAAFNAKTDRVAVGGSDDSVRVWDTQTGRELVLAGMSGKPIDLAFGPGDDFLAVLVADGEVSRIVILDATTGRERRRPILPLKYVDALAVHPDGKIVAGTVMEPLAWGRQLERLQAWSAETGAELWHIPQPPNRFVNHSALAFSPDRQLLAATTADRTVTLWDVQTRKKRLSLKGGAGAIVTLAFSADSQRLAAGGNDGQVTVWDTRTGQEVYSFKSESFWVDRLAFSPNKAVLAAGGMVPLTVSLLSAETVPNRIYLEGSATLAILSPDGSRAAAALSENDLLLFDAVTGKPLYPPLKGHTYPVSLLVFSDDGKRLVSRAWGGEADSGKRVLAEVMVWDVETGKQLASFDHFDDKAPHEVALSADGSRVAARLRVSPKGSSGPATVQNGEIRVWDVETGQLLRPPIPIDAITRGPMFVDDGKVVVVQKQSREVVGWSVETGNQVKVAGDPFTKSGRDTRTKDGRRLLPFNGTYFIQPVPDERELERLRAQGQPDPAWHADMARSAEGKKQWFAAVFHLGRLLLKSPADTDLLCRRARAYTALGRFDEAGADCIKAIGLQQNSAEAWLTRGLLEYRRNRLDAARDDLARAAAIDPDDPATAAWQAFLHLVDQKGKEAAAAEKRLLDRLTILHPGARDWLYSFNQSPAWTLLEEELTQHLVKKPKDVPLLRLRGAVRAATQGKTIEARDDFLQATKVMQGDVLAWKGVAGVIYRSQFQSYGPSLKKDLDDGLAACRVVLDRDSEAWDFWYLRGLFCVRDRQDESAIKAFTAALELRPEFTPALRERGERYAQLGRWAEAVADFARAAELTGPADPTPWEWLALAQLGQGDAAAFKNYKKTCTRMLAMFDRPPPLIWAGGAFAAGPFNPCGAPFALHIANQASWLSPHAVNATAVLCTARPDTLADWQRLVYLTQKSTIGVRGKVLCRAGRHDEAVKLLELWRPSRLGVFFQAPLLALYLALAEYGRGRTAEAKQLLKETTVWLERAVIFGAPVKDNPKQNNRDQLPWTERVQIDQLRRELEGLLEDKRKKLAPER